MEIFALVLQDRLAQYAADIRRLENRINDLEVEIMELKRSKNDVKTPTTLDNLLMKGATYAKPEIRRNYESFQPLKLTTGIKIK